MKSLLSFFILLFLSITSFTQSNMYSISGKVIDAVTKAPMQAASVFAQNTTIGTATGTRGDFALLLPNGGYDLIVTFTGYETVSRRITTTDADNMDIVIEVKQKESAMEDVVVKASNEVKDGWEKYGDLFLDNFIGKTINSKSCVIKNKEVLSFYFYKKRNRLKVLAAAPIEIENPALGYNLKYTLDSFTHEFSTQACIYTGYPLFEEMQPADTIQQSAWREDRLKAYRGSLLHFMRSVYNKSLKAEGFEIQFVAKNNDLETAVRVSDFYGALNYVKDDSTQLVAIIPNQPDIAVLYNKEMPDSAYVVINEETPKKFQLSVIAIAANEFLAIEQNGYYFDQNDITISGYWTWDKVGDLLPYDYAPVPSR